MKSLLNRLSVGKKIIGLVTLTLVLMVGVALHSFVRIHSTNDEIADLTEIINPLTDAICRIETHALEEEVRFERIVRLYHMNPIDKERIVRERALYEQRDAEIIKELETGTGLAADGVNRARLKEDAVELARIDYLLNNIAREHQDYHTQGTQILTTLAGGDYKTGALEDGLQKEEDDFNAAMALTLAKMVQLNEKQSKVTALHEAGVLTLAAENLFFTGGTFLLGVLVASLITVRLVRPLRKLRDSAQAVEAGNLDVDVPVTSRDEVGMLSSSFNSMVGELKVKEQIKSTFGKYLDPRIVESILQNNGNTRTSGEKQVMTVFFSDVQGFSAISESLTPAGLVNVMNQYFTLATEPIVRYQGVVDKFIGDAVMAFWGPPFTTKEAHARLACLAALDQFSKLEELRRMMPDLTGLRKNVPEINIRVGLSTGELVVGNIGSTHLRSYTVMGDTVNTASRLEGANKEYGTRILMSEETWQMVKDEVEAREIDLIRVLGKSEPVHIFELLGMKGAVQESVLELREQFEKGIRTYQQQDWAQAQAQFERCLSINPFDQPSKLFLQRVTTLRATPPPNGWDGVWHLTKK